MRFFLCGYSEISSDLLTNKLVRKEERHIIEINAVINQADILILNIYIYVKFRGIQFHKMFVTDITLPISLNPLIRGNFKTPLASIKNSSRQKRRRKSSKLHIIIHLLYIADIYKIVCPSSTSTHSI